MAGGRRETPLFSIRQETYPLLERSAVHTRVCAKSPILLLLLLNVTHEEESEFSQKRRTLERDTVRCILKALKAPVYSSHCTSISVTLAPGGPLLQKSISCSTSAFLPSKIASTLHSDVFRTQPVTFLFMASLRVSTLKKTPWTLPLTKTWALTFMFLINQKQSTR